MALRCEPIDIGRLDQLIALACQVHPPQIVDQDEDDIRRPIRRYSGRKQRHLTRECDYDSKHAAPFMEENLGGFLHRLQTKLRLNTLGLSMIPHFDDLHRRGSVPLDLNGAEEQN